MPPMFVAALCVGAGASLWMATGRILLSAIVFLYLLANLLASVITARKAGWRNLARLSLAYAIIHLSYGSGLLVGLVRFRKRWHDRAGVVPRLRVRQSETVEPARATTVMLPTQTEEADAALAFA